MKREPDISLARPESSFSGFVRSRLAALDYGQKDLARAARVTDSYVSQLLTRKKSPPAPDRTDIYRKMEALLRVEPGELERLYRALQNLRDPIHFESASDGVREG